MFSAFTDMQKHFREMVSDQASMMRMANAEYHATNPPVPLFAPVHGLTPGKRITINGVLPHHSERATINLKSGSDIALHFDIRYNDKSVVLNTMQHGNWQTEEKPGYFPFKHDAPFNIVIDVEDAGYRITVNGQSYAFYNHRIPSHAITMLEVEHEVRLTYVEVIDTHAMSGFGGHHHFRRHHHDAHRVPPATYCAPAPQPYAPPPFNPSAGFGGHHHHDYAHHVPPASCTPPPQPYGSPTCNPLCVPHSQPLYNFAPGQTISINGSPTYNADRFVVNLKSGHDNFVFHFNPRFQQRQVVRNTANCGNWQMEETSGPPFPFQQNQPFYLQIQNTPIGFIVTINGSYFCQYNHRMAWQAINQLEITGDVQLQNVHVH